MGKTIIEDFRTDDEKLDTKGFVVANTQWKYANSDKLQNIAICAPFKNKEERKELTRIFIERNDLERVRVVEGIKRKYGRTYRTKGKDRIIIHNFGVFTNHVKI